MMHTDYPANGGRDVAVLAILLDEPEAAEFAQLIEDDPAPVILAASVVEAGIVLTSRYGPDARGDLQDFLAQGGLQVEPMSPNRRTWR